MIMKRWSQCYKQVMENISDQVHMQTAVFYEGINILYDVAIGPAGSAYI